MHKCIRCSLKLPVIQKKNKCLLGVLKEIYSHLMKRAENANRGAASCIHSSITSCPPPPLNLHLVRFLRPTCLRVTLCLRFPHVQQHFLSRFSSPLTSKFMSYCYHMVAFMYPNNFPLGITGSILFKSSYLLISYLCFYEFSALF